MSPNVKGTGRASAAKKAAAVRPEAEAAPIQDAADDTAQIKAEDILPRARELGAKAYQDGTQVMQDASELLGTVQQIGHEVGSNLSRSMSQRPYAVLGGAAAVGFVLGRGLTLGMSRSLIGWGGKLALSYAMRRVTQSLSPFA